MVVDVLEGKVYLRHEVEFMFYKSSDQKGRYDDVFNRMNILGDGDVVDGNSSE